MANAILFASGIYAIRNTVNGKRYIGSAFNLRTRKTRHFGLLRKSKHPNPKLQGAWLKHGESAFVFEVLELVPNNDALIAAEQRWIDKFVSHSHAGYNIAIFAARAMAGRTMSEESKAKISAAHKGWKNSPQHIERTRLANIGIKKTPEHCAKISKARMGVKQSPEAVRKSAESRTGLPRTEAAKKSISDGSKGKIISQAQRALLSKALIGRKQSPELIARRIAASVAAKAANKAARSKNLSLFP